MPHDHHYLRQLLDIRHPPQLPVLWLSVPWLGGVVWSARAVGSLSHAAGHNLWIGLDWAFRMMAFWELAAVGLLLTWAWLYLAWPEHPRVCCWAALAGLIMPSIVSPTLQPVLPLFITGCGAAAALEQAVATRRERTRLASAATPPA